MLRGPRLIHWNILTRIVTIPGCAGFIKTAVRSQNKQRGLRWYSSYRNFLRRTRTGILNQLQVLHSLPLHQGQGHPRQCATHPDAQEPCTRGEGSMLQLLFTTNFLTLGYLT